MSAEISPDGKRLLYRDGAGFFVRAIDSGENQPLRLPEAFEAIFAAWSPSDPTGLLLVARLSEQEPYAIWSVSLLSGAPRRIATAGGDTEFLGVAWSPDSRRFADVRGGLENERWSLVLETRDLAVRDVLEILSDQNLGSPWWAAPLSWLAHGRIV